MGKYTFPERPDDDHLGKRPVGNQEGKGCKKGYRGPLDRLCRKAAEPCQQEPAKKRQGDGDFIAVELGQEFSDGKELGGDGANARPKDGTNN